MANRIRVQSDPAYGLEFHGINRLAQPIAWRLGLSDMRMTLLSPTHAGSSR